MKYMTCILNEWKAKLKIFAFPPTVIKDWRVQCIVPMAVMFALEQAFFGSIYPTCVGANKQLGFDSIRLIGLSSIFLGIGELLGTALQFLSFVQKYRGYALW